MSKEQAVIEIRNSAIKLLVGYLNDNEGKVNLLYNETIPLEEDILGAYITSKENVIKELSKIIHLKTNDGLKININEATSVYPSFGLNVYSSTKTTNTVDPNSTICQIDVDNVLSLIKKERLPNPNDKLVEILPLKFYIDGGRTYEYPPINEVSSSVQLSANVYALPKNLTSSYEDCIMMNGINCSKKVIAPVGVSYYLDKQKYKYKKYILVDFNTRITTCSLVGASKVYGSSYFELGINHLVDTIVDEFKISEDEALKLLNLYGLDLRTTTYDPFIVETYIEGMKVKIRKEQLNTLIINFLKKWLEGLKICISSLNPSALSVGIISLYGESLDFKGFKEFIKDNCEFNVDFVSPNVVGCEDSSFMNCVAALYYSSFYKGSCNDMNFVKKVNKVSRGNEEYSEIKDEL